MEPIPAHTEGQPLASLPVADERALTSEAPTSAAAAPPARWPSAFIRPVRRIWIAGRARPSSPVSPGRASRAAA